MQLSSSRRYYERFVRDGVGEGHREEFHCGGEDSRVLADDHFLERILNRPSVAATTLESVIRQVCTAYGVEERELRSVRRARVLAEARGVVGLLALEHRSATLTKVAERFGRDVSAISVAVRRIMDRDRSDEAFAVRLQSMLSNAGNDDIQ